MFFIRYDWPKFIFCTSSDQRVHFIDVVASATTHSFFWRIPVLFLKKTKIYLYSR
jgi:hypothetical protein